MILKNLRLRNFGKFVDFECEFDGQITRLCGVNKSGKTTVGITAIWACLKGISANDRNGQLIGDRYRFIGGEKSSADIELTLIDEIEKVEIEVRNHITTSGNKITFDAPEGYHVGEDWLKDLLSVSLMSAKLFSQLSPKEQALALGIDTSTYDTKMLSLKEEFTGINRDYRAFGDVPRRPEVKRVSVLDLVKKKDRIEDRNRGRQQQRQKKESLKARKEQVLGQIEEFEDELRAAREILTETNAALEASPTITKDESTAAVVKEIKASEETNVAAAEYEKQEENRKKKAAAHAELEGNKGDQAELAKRRIKYIKGALKIPVEGLEVDDAGGLLLTKKPIREPYFSKGELEMAVARIYTATNPKLKVRCIDDFELLDDKNQKVIVEDLLEAGFQVITAEVREPKTKTKKKNVVVLRECAKVG